jgi:hypothetical protein
MNYGHFIFHCRVKIQTVAAWKKREEIKVAREIGSKVNEERKCQIDSAIYRSLKYKKKLPVSVFPRIFSLKNI